jgi:uncharacterized repeat protein (TIGR04138 family)
MKIEIAPVGEFMASDDEVALLNHYTKLHPHYPPKELLTMLYIIRCIEFADWSKDCGVKRRHVQAIDILTAAPLMAASVFGDDGRKWLRALSLASSHEIGLAVFRLVGDGVLMLRENDCVEDFNIYSQFDDFMKIQSE